MKDFHGVLQKVPVPAARGHRHFHFTSIKAARFFAFALMLAGIACMLFTSQVHKLFPIILGILMQGIGICQIYRGIVTGEYRCSDTKLTSTGIIMAILGGVILYHHHDADSIIGAIWGMIGLAKGSETLNLAIHDCCNRKPYAFKLIHGAVELILGILLLIDPDEAVRHHVFILGIELCAIGIQAVLETKRRSA